jgi:GSCFA family/Polysaccharide biosynthesis enzyme WcbI
MTVSREAVFKAFQLFLGRIPNLEKDIQAHMHAADELTLAKILVNSSEFAKKNQRVPLKDQWASSKNTRVLVIGNCQVDGIASLMQAMSTQISTKSFLVSDGFVSGLKNGNLDIKPFVDADLVFSHPSDNWISDLEILIPNFRNKVRHIPSINFSAFHPDCVYVQYKSQAFSSPISHYNSSLIFHGWKNGFSHEETMRLFSSDVYDELGFYDYWDASHESLKNVWTQNGLELADKVNQWSKLGCWMHTINHPKLFVLADLARAALVREKIEPLPYVENYLQDELSDYSCWPVYPEIGRRLGIPNLSQPYFKKGKSLCSADRPVSMLNLDEFVSQSFAIYSKYSKDELHCERLNSAKYKELDKFVKIKGEIRSSSAVVSSSSAINTKNPYLGLPDYQFWRRSIEKLPMTEVNPVVRSGFKLSRTDKVATAGSCFAQHISRTLQKKGFNYYISENGDKNLAIEDVLRRNYGVFSARFGNLYSARQLVQLFDRAYTNFIPVDQHWIRSDGKFVDPFRPQVEPDGFDSIADMDADRVKHFAAVREMFETLDVMVFTLGLTEAWRSRTDGAVFPVAPGVSAGEMDANKYEFINFGVAEVVSDMQTFIKKLSHVNPKAKMLLTVSPVPLVATYEDRHVLVSTTYSKSVLRAAAEEICRDNALCDYFPSYEITTGNFNKGSYFESDFRSVKQEGVDHVMGLFLKHYSSDVAISLHTPPASHLNRLDKDLMLENAAVAGIICDEEALDPARK